MIKLFRNIRQKLLTEGKSANYLKYAFGEIVLVVIGILIALQINNWNEQRKKRIEEISQLKNIQEDIMLDTSDISFNIKYHKLSFKSQKELLNYLSTQEWKPKTQIDYEFAMGTPIILTLHENSFTNLKDNNLNIITNKTLLKQISNHFDFNARMILKVENDLEEYKTYTMLRPYFLKYFHHENTYSVITNNEFNNAEYFSPEIAFNKISLIDTLGIKKDEAFRIVLSECISFTDFKIKFYEDFLKRIFELNTAINEELKLIE